MGSPSSPIVANLCMKVFAGKALRRSQSHLKLWKRSVDDTFVIQHTIIQEEPLTAQKI